MRKINYWLLISAALLFWGLPGFGAAQEKAPASAQPPAAVSPPEKAAPQEPVKAPAPTPDPKQIFQQMCDFLKKQQQFSFKAEVDDDRVYRGDLKLQYGMDAEAFFRRPDKLRINGEGDLEDKQLFFDGKTLTLYDKNKNQYATLEVTGNIDAALDLARKDYGLRVGLAELGSNHLGERAEQGLTNSLYVGESKVRGVICHHLAFDKERAHFQLWVETGDKPLLRKVVVTQKKLSGSPQWTAYFSDWNFAPQLADQLFTFTLPEGAQKVKFIPLAKPKAPAPKKAKPKRKGGAS